MNVAFYVKQIILRTIMHNVAQYFSRITYATHCTELGFDVIDNIWIRNATNNFIKMLKSTLLDGVNF